MRVRCPHCQVILKVDDKFRGRTAPCAKCGGAFVLEPVEAASATTAATAAGSEAPLLIPFADGATAQAPAVDPITSLPAIPRAGTIEPPGKSTKAKIREIQDIKEEGNRYLFRIRLLYFVLGAVIIAYNVYQWVSIDGLVATFKSEMSRLPGVRVDLAKLDQLARNLGWMMRVECVLYFLLGATLCVLAWPIYKAPVVCTFAAAATYTGVWILNLLLVEAVFGDLAAGMAVFNLGTVVKLAIISGLWYCLMVGIAYRDQVIRPIRELLKAEFEGQANSSPPTSPTDTTAR
jgi:hypothetical protein